MEIIRAKDFADLGKEAARLIAAQVRLFPESILGLATGSTVISTYEELIRLHREDGLDFSHVTTFNLDEYYQLKPENEQSYTYFMYENLFKHINIDLASTYLPDGCAEDMNACCENYDALIESYGGTDLQLLGIGPNGHIAFNEPGPTFTAATHLVPLSEQTIAANARFFASEDEVPRQAVTMGMKSILSARIILLLASGSSKTEALRRMVTGPVDPYCPASILQIHPNVIIVADDAALAGLI